MNRKGVILVMLCLLLLAAVVVLGVYQVVERPNHEISRGITMFAFIFVTGFISLLILRVGIFAILSLVQQVWYRIQFARYLRRKRRSGRRMPVVSIIVPAYNEGAVIEVALESHVKMTYPNLEIIVVDDGSSDDTADRARACAKRFPGRCILVHKIPNGGKGNALNYGIRKAKGEFILCVDADSKVDPDSLWYAIRHFNDPRIAAVAGNIKVMNRQSLLSGLQALEYVIGQNLTRRVLGIFHSVNIVPGPFSLFRASALREAGGFEDDTFAEDCDLTLRLLAKGWRVVDEMNAIARTEAPEGALSFIRQRYRWTRGVLQSIAKHKSCLLGTGGPRMFILLWMMLFDGIVWPIANFVCHLCVFFLIFEVGLATYLVYWWIHFTLLDAGLALVCIAAERENPFLVLQTIIYRLFFVVMMDLCKIMASIEEFIGVKMGWGKLKRLGHDYSEEGTEIS
jgi:biofilm PGA synthesis N-glycosyltransferase PgaC